MSIRVVRALWMALLGAALATPVHAQTSFLDYQRLKGEGKLEEALNVLRREFADPSFVHRVGGQPVFLRQHFLFTLGEYAALVGLKPEFDLEARKIYEEGVSKFAGNDGELQALMANGYALYYSRSHRNGLALPYFRKDLEHWQRVGNRFRMMLGNDAIAGAYQETGEFALGRLYVSRALEIAAGHFVLGQRPSDINEWLQYWTILARNMDVAAQTRDLALLDRLWALQEPIEARYWGNGNGAMTALVAAQMFALAGQGEKARATLARGSELLAGAKARAPNERARRLMDAAHVCTQAMVDSALNQHAAAVSRLEECLKLNDELRLREREASFKLRLGLAYEATGAPEKAVASYRAAIASAESTRESYGIAERAKFFNTFVRLPYWGLVRMQAKRAAEGDEAAFFEALHTSELVRGRQLGELIDPEMSKRISAGSMRDLRQRLPEDAVVLAYTVTDTEITLLGLARDRMLAAVTPYDAGAFAALARGIARDLAEPKSNTAQLDGRLLEMSRAVLAAARPLLAGKKRIIALTDGVMNTVPFELFSAADDTYRPLVAEFTVSSSPSLVFIEYAERQRQSGTAGNLLALADPRYGKPGSIAGATLEEVQAATRGSRHLAYFDPLPETRTEAQAISKMFDGQKVELLLGEQALESRIKTLDLTQFGFLHFATHGILGGEVPGIGEPALVLGAEPGEDGFLTSSEVGKLRISSDLTVLSACNTGSGEFVTGEGVMGMSRAFLTAGSRSVVVSLWPVASEQTVRLMVDFYRYLRAGRPAADALRAAKLDMIAQARKTGAPESHPFFWAAFILLGG